MVACAAGEEPATRPAAKSREELILEHMPQVRLVARRIYKGLPPSVALEDLVSAGVVGLIAAIDRYESHLAVKLKTYAEYKIRGAILDSLRMLDWAPRQHRRRAREIEAVVLDLEHQLGRRPSEEEVAASLGVNVPQYREWAACDKSLKVGSLETVRGDGNGGQKTVLLPKTEEPSPSQIFERAELGALLGEALKKMPRLEAQVVSLYFYEGMTLREIAQQVNLHESRISQLKGQAMARLRTQIRHVWKNNRTRSAATR